MNWDYLFDDNGPHNREELMKILYEFNNYDPKSFSFRYPMDTKGNLSLPDNFEFNIKHFCKTLDPILEFFHGCIIRNVEEYPFECEQAYEGMQEGEFYS